MFSCKITSSDAFKMMSLAAQALYFQLGMEADDDGFVNNAVSIARSIGAGVDEIEEIISNRFAIRLSSKLLVIKHWKINNYIQKDRYHETAYKAYKDQLIIKDNDSYTEKDKSDTRWSANGYDLDTTCIQDVSKVDTEVRIGKDSIGYNPLSESKDSSSPLGGQSPKKTHKFQKPSVEEVRAYCKERKNNVDADAFIDFYESKGWKVGNQSMKDWKAAVRTWERSEDRHSPRTSGNRYNGKAFRPTDLNGQYDDLPPAEVIEV